MKRPFGIIFLTLLFVTSSGGLFAQGSYTKLKGSRLKRLLKSKGTSEKFKAVSFRCPPKPFLSPKRVGSFISIDWQGLVLKVRANDPYWLQCKRKLAKSAKGQVLVKGIIKVWRSKKTKPYYYLSIKTLQKFGKSSGMKRKN